MSAKYERYQDYVIRDGRFIGDFEAMYQDHDDPWAPDTKKIFPKQWPYTFVKLTAFERSASSAAVTGISPICSIRLDLRPLEWILPLRL